MRRRPLISGSGITQTLHNPLVFFSRIIRVYARTLSRGRPIRCRRPSIATFYAMVVNDALELGILIRNMTQVVTTALIDLSWYSFEMWLRAHQRHLLVAR